MTQVVIVTGPVSVGKTAVTWEMAEVLDERGIPYLRFDADAVHYRPHPQDGRFGERVMLRVLEYTWRLLRSERVLLPKVVETRAWIDRYRAVIPDADVSIVRLAAPRELVADRVREREIGARRLARGVGARRLDRVGETARLPPLEVSCRAPRGSAPRRRAARPPASR